LRILHFADVHLDRPFGGLEPQAARAARAALEDGFRRCLQAARDRAVDLVTIGGDLWEHEHVTVDTARSVAFELGRVEIPVLLVAGNHDPAVPGGPYDRTAWPANVTVVRSSEPTEHRYGDVSVWAASWTGGRLDASFLDTFRVPEDGCTHLLLLHGTCQGVAWFADQVDAHCPFTADQVRRAGFAGCLAGHWHRAVWDRGVCYPGSPEPLGWADEGPHGYALVETGSALAVELVGTARCRFETVEVDCAGAQAGAEVRARAERRLAEREGDTTYLRLRLVGAVAPGCDVDAGELERDLAGRVAVLRVEDRTTTAYDLDTLAGQPTVEGRFVRMLQERLPGPEGREREVAELALRLGLHALRGERLPHVG
jgi:DNA repair exonuclease SbcCD nuclease subunit